jgi:hypothetical protein
VASRSASKIESALKSKGFHLDEHRHHRYLTLHVDGRSTTVRTRLSHGRGDYGDDLLSKMQKQLYLPWKRDLLDLIDCPLSGDGYVELLRQQGTL